MYTITDIAPTDADIAGANNHHFTGFGVHIQISSTNGR